MYGLLEPKVQQLFSAKAATGNSAVVDVRHYKNSTIVISTAGSAVFTYKIRGAIGEVNDVKNAAIGNTTGRIDFASAQSITNDWFEISSVAYTGTDGVTAVKVPVDSIDFLCVSITAISAGTVSSTISCHNI